MSSPFVVVVYHVTIVAIGHGLLKKFWPMVLGCVQDTERPYVSFDVPNLGTPIEKIRNSKTLYLQTESESPVRDAQRVH